MPAAPQTMKILRVFAPSRELFSEQAPCLGGTNNDENIASAVDVVHS
jgi:hypothetical protein